MFFPSLFEGKRGDDRYTLLSSSSSHPLSRCCKSSNPSICLEPILPCSHLLCCKCLPTTLSSTLRCPVCYAPVTGYGNKFLSTISSSSSLSPHSSFTNVSFCSSFLSRKTVSTFVSSSQHPGVTLHDFSPSDHPSLSSSLSSIPSLPKTFLRVKDVHSKDVFSSSFGVKQGDLLLSINGVPCFSHEKSILLLDNIFRSSSSSPSPLVVEFVSVRDSQKK